MWCLSLSFSRPRPARPVTTPPPEYSTPVSLLLSRPALHHQHRQPRRPPHRLPQRVGLHPSPQRCPQQRPPPRRRIFGLFRPRSSPGDVFRFGGGRQQQHPVCASFGGIRVNEGYQTQFCTDSYRQRRRGGNRGC